MEAAARPSDHITAEALIACREIARRHAAARPLGDRLATTEAVLLATARRCAAPTARPAPAAWAYLATDSDKHQAAVEAWCAHRARLSPRWLLTSVVSTRWGLSEGLLGRPLGQAASSRYPQFLG